MDNKDTLWPSSVTLVVSHLIALSYTSIIARYFVEAQTYSGWVCFSCIVTVGLLLIAGSSAHLSDILDLMGYSLWKEPLWVMACNIGAFSCVHSIYLITRTESGTVWDTPPPRSSFPGPEEPYRGEYTEDLLIKLEANQARFKNNRKREEDYRISAGELPPYRRALGEDVEDPPSPPTEDEDEEEEEEDMPNEDGLNPDFWRHFDPDDRSTTEYPTDGESPEASPRLDMRPRVRPENMYRRPVPIPGFPPQPLARIRPETATPAPQAEPEGRASRSGRSSAIESQSSAPRTRSNFLSTAVDFTFPGGFSGNANVVEALLLFLELGKSYKVSRTACLEVRRRRVGRGFAVSAGKLVAIAIINSLG
ncbi:hypothetical protein HOY82DRAFT_612221 [Tuber indicum]|nr:hypothetical protein HOY82DRAFT_612221 [Tuber indicum]